MPVKVVHLHPRGGAGVQPTGAGCTVVYWQNFTLKNLGLNATLHPLSILVHIAELFSKQRDVSHGAGQVVECSCSESPGAMAG